MAWGGGGGGDGENRLVCRQVKLLIAWSWVGQKREESSITLRVSNSGFPITEQRLQEVNELLSGNISLQDFKGERNGMALYNIKERIAIFFRGKATIQLMLQENCTATVITINKK